MSCILGLTVFEFFTPLPLDAPQNYHRSRGVSIRRVNVETNGRFVPVKDYVYIRVAKRIGETQVGINLFYLLDNATILGYRNSVGYYLRKGAKKRRRDG